MNIIEDAPIEVTVHRSARDGALVVQIDTTTETGTVRVNLNDGPALYHGNPDKDDSPVAMLNSLAHWLKETNSSQHSNEEGDAMLRAHVHNLLYGNRYVEAKI